MCTCMCTFCPFWAERKKSALENLTINNYLMPTICCHSYKWKRPPRLVTKYEPFLEWGEGPLLISWHVALGKISTPTSTGVSCKMKSIGLFWVGSCQSSLYSLGQPLPTWQPLCWLGLMGFVVQSIWRALDWQRWLWALAGGSLCNLSSA